MSELTQEALIPGTPQGQYTADYFIYPLIFDSIAPGATAQNQIQIQADSSFEWMSSTYYAFDVTAPAQTANTRIIPPLRVQIIDSGSGRQLLDEPISVNNLFGSGNLAYILPQYRSFKPRSSIIIQVTSFEPGGGVTYGLELCLHGRKLFQYSNQPVLSSM